MCGEDGAAILADIETLVRCESPSSVPDAVAASADLVAAVGERHLGTAPERIVLDGCPHLRWRFGAGPARVLLLAHHDTVWPLGSLETHPFSRHGRGAARARLLRHEGRAGARAARARRARRARRGDAAGHRRRGARLAVVARADRGRGGRAARAALVLEASADGGALKTARKGVSLYQVRAVGRAAHAGLEPERGVNATVELAHQVLTVSRARGRRARHHRDADGAVVGDGGEHRARGRGVRRGRADVGHRRAGAGARGDELAAARGARRGARGQRRAEPAAAAPRRRPPGCSRSPSSLAAGLGLPPLASAAVGGASDGNFTAGVGNADARRAWRGRRRGAC